MKKHFTTVTFNLLKVWGAAWVGFLIGSIPLYIIRANSVPRNTENVLFGIIGGIGAMITLFFFFKWEGRKREFRLASPSVFCRQAYAYSCIGRQQYDVPAPQPQVYD